MPVIELSATAAIGRTSAVGTFGRNCRNPGDADQRLGVPT